MVRRKIFEEIGDSKVSLIVDEASDESRKEQMAIVLRFADAKGFIQERLFDVIHVKDTTSLTLYTSICATLSRHKFTIQNLRGQGYDGASNMRGEWKGLQALFMKDFPQAYYVHCMAHCLQLALVAAAKEVHCVQEFFSNLSFIVNAVTASCKRNDELQAAQADEVARKLALDEHELDTGRGANQMSTLQRPCDTRWSSHLNSICSLMSLYDPTCIVLENIKTDGSGYKTKGDACTVLKRLSSFEFIFILHLMKDILGITNVLCQALQEKSQDIVNAMSLVTLITNLLNKLREVGLLKLSACLDPSKRYKAFDIDCY